jgi:NAD(P)-dependent dehydrogenase (short-subunit alcohol dehydrogenase family)
MTGEVINTPERFAKWERELAKRQLSTEDAARQRTQWSSDQDVRDTRWGTPEEIANPIVFAVSERQVISTVGNSSPTMRWINPRTAVRLTFRMPAGAVPASACVRQRPLRLRAKRQ